MSEADSNVMRTMTIMLSSLFGLFIAMIVIARTIVY